MRKWSIANSEFKSFYSAFEQQLNSTNMESNDSKSFASSEWWSNQAIERFSSDSKFQRNNKGFTNQNNSNLLVERRVTKFSHQRSANISSENNQEYNEKKLKLNKINSLRKKTADSQSYNTANLLSIMGKLSQIEDEISN